MARQETIKILRSEVPSATPSLTAGEVAVNLADRKFFVGGTGGTSDRITFRDELSTVASVNGASQNIVITGDSASMRVVTGLGIDETTTFVISSRIASTSLTGVASFYSNDFSVSPTGQVSISTSGATPVVFRDAFGNLVSPKWESTLTLTGGNGVEVHRSNAVANTIIFSGTTASAARSGVASFLSDHFTVSSTGHVSSKGVITINSTPPDGNGNFNIASATVVTGDGGSLRGDGVVITARFSSTGISGVASFSSDDFDVSATGHVTVKAGGIGNTQLANSSFTFRDSVQGSDTISLGNTLNLTGGPGISVRRTETDTFAVQGTTATTSTLGVASFNSSYFSVSSGAVSLASPYQATGDSVQAGHGIAISANKTIFNIGVTAFNGLTGSVSLTGCGGAVRGSDNSCITVRNASGTLTGVASFDPIYFSVGGTGHVTLAAAYQATGDTVITVPGSGIALSTSGKTDTIFNIGVTGFNGLTGNITVTGDGGSLVGRDNNKFTNRLAGIGVTGVASFVPSYFTVSDGIVSLASAYQATGDTIQAGSGIAISANKTITNIGVTGIGFGSDVGLTGKVNITAGSNITITQSGNLITFSGVAQQVTAVTGDGAAIVGRDNSNITARLATTGVTGVASFLSTHFAVSGTGHVSLASAYQATGDSVQAGSGIAISANKTITNIGVTGFNGLTGNITVTGDGGSLVGKDNNRFTNRLADASATGVASFNSTYFSVGATGHVTLAAAYQATGDTVITVPGSGIALSTSGKTDTIFNIGVTGFNGLTGNITVTGDGGSLVGKDNNKFTNRLATTGVTGVASFNSTYFSVGATGHVTLATAYQATGDTIQAGSGIAISANKTIFNIGVTGIGFGSDVGLTGKVNITAGSNITITQSGNLITFSGVAQQVTAVTGDGAAIVGRDNSNITARLATTGVTGVASFLSTYFTVSGTGHVSLASAYQATGDSVQAGSGIAISANKTISNIGVTGFNGLTGNITVTGDGGSLVGIANNRFTNRLATTGVTGVASFLSTHFTVSGTGHVSLATAYQATGDSVQAGSGIAISANKTITNIGVTGFNGLTGNITVTGDGGSLVGRDNNKFTNRLATTGVTGVASFNSTYFSVGATGHVSLATAYQATGDTVITVPGSGIALSTSGKTDTIFNIGVTGFNGLTGNITVTGDGGSLVGRDNNKFTNRITQLWDNTASPTTGLTGVSMFTCRDFVVSPEGLVSLAAFSQCEGDVSGCNCADFTTEETCVAPCEWFIPFPSGIATCRCASAFNSLYSGLGVSADVNGELAFLYFDIGNLSAAPSGTTILSTDSILFYDASESGLIKTKRATISKLILDNNNLFTVPSKSSNQLTTTRGSSAIEFDVVLGQVAANNQGLIKGATAFAYIEQNTVRTINGLTGALQAVGSINGCSGNSLTITGTVNEVNVTNSCPTITIGLPDNVTIPYISGTGATFTGTVNANLFIGSVDGGTF